MKGCNMIEVQGTLLIDEVRGVIWFNDATHCLVRICQLRKPLPDLAGGGMMDITCPKVFYSEPGK